MQFSKIPLSLARERVRARHRPENWMTLTAEARAVEWGEWVVAYRVPFIHQSSLYCPPVGDCIAVSAAWLNHPVPQGIREELST